jgi:hypothetical protein
MAVLGLACEDLIDNHFERPRAQHTKKTGENYSQKRETEFLPVRAEEGEEVVNPKPHGV